MSEAAIFDGLISEFYRVWFRYHPLAAIFAGVSGYEGLLAVDGDDDMGALDSWLSNLLVSLEELNYKALDVDRQLDLNLLFGAVMIEHRTLLEHDWRHRDPARYLPLRTLQELVVRQPEKFCEAMQGVLEGTADYLRDARGTLSELPEVVSTLWLADALETAEAGAPWLKRLQRELPQTRECCANQGHLQSLGNEAAEAVEDFHEFLLRDLAPQAQGTSECGPELIGHLLRHRHQLDLSADDALHMVRLLRDRLQQKLEAQDLDGPRILAKMATEERLKGSARLQAYQVETERLRQFVVDQDLLAPPQQTLKLQVTESCFSKCECGSYLRSESGGILLIPHETQLGGGESLAAIRLRSFYEGWAGLHFLAWSGGMEARSLVRQINPSAAFKRGWAHYLSYQLEARGYFSEEDLMQLFQRRLLLAEQAVLDLEFHMGLVDSLQVLERLRGLSEMPGWAEAGLTMLSRRPTDAFMALLDATLIDVARRLVLEQRAELSLRDFHSCLLAHGPVSLPLVLRRVFGDSVCQQVMDEVFA